MFTYENLPRELSDKFGNKKKNSVRLAEIYKRLGFEKKSARVKDCGSFLQFGLYDDNSVHLHSANFCKDLLCPVCAWRKSLKLYSEVYQCVSELSKTSQFIFVTLTLKNCSAGELKDNITLLKKAYTRLMRKKRMSFVKGAFKALEVTYNNKTCEFHPHLHIIFAVSSDYFQSSDYLMTDELVQLWQSALQVDYSPICFVEKVKPNRNKKDSDPLAAAVAEVAKYPVKAADFLSYDDDTNDFVVLTLTNALSSSRMFEFYGCFSEIRKKLKLEENEDDLIHIEQDGRNNSVLIALLSFSWNSEYKEYIMTDVQPVSDCRSDERYNSAGFNIHSQRGRRFSPGVPFAS